MVTIEGGQRGEGRETPCKAIQLFSRKTSDLVGYNAWWSILIKALHFARIDF